MIDGLLVLAPAWPSRSSGYGIAIRSSLSAYSQVAHKTFFVGITPHDEFEEWQARQSDHDDGTLFRHIPIPRRAPAIRFARSLGRSVPAVAVEYMSSSVRSGLQPIVQNLYRNTSKPLTVVFEDLPVSGLQPWIRSKCPDATCIIRSHNVLGEAFQGVAETNLGLRRLAWKHEVGQIRSFEQDMLQRADAVWTISSHDAHRYKACYDQSTQGRVGICFPPGEFEPLEGGSDDVIVHVGTADLRKGHGLRWFVDQVWPHVRDQHPDTRLLLAGRNTEQFNSVDRGIEGSGFIDDDKTFMNKGRIFINPQHHGSGLQVKSAVAMLAARALVSTTTGIEGVGGREGHHYLVADNDRSMAQKILALMENPQIAREIARAGSSFARSRFRCGPIRETVKDTLQSLRHTPT